MADEGHLLDRLIEGLGGLAGHPDGQRLLSEIPFLPAGVFSPNRGCRWLWSGAGFGSGWGAERQAQALLGVLDRGGFAIGGRDFGGERGLGRWGQKRLGVGLLRGGRKGGDGMGGSGREGGERRMGDGRGAGETDHG